MRKDKGLSRRHFALGAAALPLWRAAAAVRAPLPRVLLVTDAGPITIELERDRAPVTAGNFLHYVDRRLFDRGSFYRVVRPDNDHNPATISVVQGGLDPDYADIPAIRHESTLETGIRNTDGVLSMARDAPGTATSEFSISVGDNPALDYGGARQKDGQGFAAFGRVVAGMEVVRRINLMAATGPSDDAYTAGQLLMPKVRFISARRLA